ncbi:4615_t:CDS:2 [Acaulospora colombiana]|uniref:4615_t:CDS:1 n=1 Tax=Acaulospora colombiana TaxID=27376 RepID=A0ACA9KBV7_9GLOM|nr:4615_t:CDS:2 [Acaulospora colombiana]
MLLGDLSLSVCILSMSFNSELYNNAWNKEFALLYHNKYPAISQ